MLNLTKHKEFVKFDKKIVEQNLCCYDNSRDFYKL